MNKIILTQGLPCSGKTTWAEDYIKNDGNYVNVNRDDIRLMLQGRSRYKKFTQTREALVSAAQQGIVADALMHDKNVIISDTNLNPDFNNDWVRFADDMDVAIEWKNHFLRVPYGVCIQRDQKRKFPVGQAVIEGMYNKYKDLYWPAPVPDPQLNDAYIFDLDGTLADTSHRSPYDAAKCYDDGVKSFVEDMLILISQRDTAIIFLSGRSDAYEDNTRAWLNDVLGFTDGEYQLFMRVEGDTRKDYVVKEEMYRSYLDGEYNILGAFDDRNQIVHLWRHLGIPCFQVNYGYF